MLLSIFVVFYFITERKHVAYLHIHPNAAHVWMHLLWSSVCLLLLNCIHEGWTSQVTYVTMVPRMGNETLRPLGVATGNALSVTRVWRYICKNTTCWPATAHDVTTGVPQYKCRRENTSSASSSEACVRSMVQSLGDAVSRSPFGEPWLHT